MRLPPLIAIIFAAFDFLKASSFPVSSPNRQILRWFGAIPEAILDDLANHGPDALSFDTVQDALFEVEGIENLDSDYLMMAFFEMLVRWRIDMPGVLPVMVYRWAREYGFHYLEELAFDVQQSKRRRGFGRT